MIRFISIIFLFCSALLCANANLIAHADSAYNAGDFSLAAESYEEIAKSSGVSSQLLCNMGNAFTKTGDYGRAVIAYKRALKISPSNKEVKENLKYVESKVADANLAEVKDKKISVAPDEPSFLGSVKNSISRGVTSNAWAISALIAFTLFIACAAAYLFSQNVTLRKIGFFGGLSSLAISAVTLAFSYMARNDAERYNEGVITTYKVALKVDPDSDAKPLKNQLSRGTVLQILDSSKGNDSDKQWYKVRLNSDYVGWIAKDDFEVI